MDLLQLGPEKPFFDGGLCGIDVNEQQVTEKLWIPR